jgi:hypothetical protein
MAAKRRKKHKKKGPRMDPPSQGLRRDRPRMNANKISSRADFAPSPPLVTSAKDARPRLTSGLLQRFL